ARRPAPWNRSSEAPRRGRRRGPCVARTRPRRPPAGPASRGSAGSRARPTRRPGHRARRRAWGRRASRPRGRPVRPGGRAPSPRREPAGPTGSPAAGPTPGRLRGSRDWSVRRVGVLGRQRLDQGVVLVDLAELGCTTGGAEVVEELDVGLVVVLPLL